MIWNTNAFFPLDPTQKEKKKSQLEKQIRRYLDIIECQYSSKLLKTQSYPGSSAASVMSQEEKSQ